MVRLRSLLWPGLATAIALTILAALGLWQLERLAWKESLIAQVAARTGAAPVPFETFRSRADEAGLDYIPVSATGRFRHDLAALVPYNQPGATKGLPVRGYLVFTPLVAETGEVTMVNRGFVPEERKNPATRAQGSPEGVVTVTGLLRRAEPARWFLPADDPAANLFFTRDPVAIAAAKGLTSPPLYIDADATSNPGGFPMGGQTQISFPNNHLSYAFTWFGLAATLVGVFGVFAARRLRGVEEA
jgi:surfeit locus 1 family protein